MPLPNRLLLLSSSRAAGSGFLDPYAGLLRAALGTGRRGVFLPFAAVTVAWNDYAAQAEARFASLGVALAPLHTAADPAAALAAIDLIVVGGGNSFRLLHEMQQRDLLAPVRARIAQGATYLGWSAGANLACPTIRTTNDMPIVAPAGLAALGLAPFQINPHYTDAAPPGHMGESRDQRLAELLALDPAVTVLGLREGSALRVEGGAIELVGPHSARLFRAGAAPRELPPGMLDFA